jgi:hypothetical protein
MDYSAELPESFGAEPVRRFLSARLESMSAMSPQTASQTVIKTKVSKWTVQAVM